MNILYFILQIYPLIEVTAPFESQFLGLTMGCGLHASPIFCYVALGQKEAFLLISMLISVKMIIFIWNGYKSPLSGVSKCINVT